MYSISMPVKREARERRRAQAPAAAAVAEPERVPAPAAGSAAARTTTADASMVTAWLDPRAARAFDGLADGTALLRRTAGPSPGVHSPQWFDVVMRAPYSAVAATPGERTKADANLREYRRRVNELFDKLADRSVSPAEGLIRYREVDSQRAAREQTIFGAGRAARLDELRAIAFRGLAVSAPGD